eukprot:scaffold66518_cov52-Phaeocystis_antarctica.AAC.1
MQPDDSALCLAFQRIFLRGGRDEQAGPALLHQLLFPGSFAPPAVGPPAGVPAPAGLPGMMLGGPAGGYPPCSAYLASAAAKGHAHAPGYPPRYRVPEHLAPPRAAASLPAVPRHTATTTAAAPPPSAVCAAAAPPRPSGSRGPAARSACVTPPERGAAEPVVVGGSGSGGGGEGDGGEEERRYDYDGELYSRDEFIAEYGGTQEWGQAERAAAPDGVVAGSCVFQRALPQPAASTCPAVTPQQPQPPPRPPPVRAPSTAAAAAATTATAVAASTP